MIYSGNATEVLGVLGLSWQEKLAGYIKTQSGVSVSSGDINRMNEAYTNGKIAGLSGINLVDYIAGASGIKNAVVSQLFVSNIEKYKTISSGNPLEIASGMLTKILLLSGIALVGYFIVKSNVEKHISI
jgi:hypothetical protein